MVFNGRMQRVASALTAGLRAPACILLFLLLGSAHAQVYRCGDARTYTDKPCDGAQRVDLRSNIMDAGPRSAGPEAPPPAAIVLPDPAAAAARPAETGGSLWERKDSDNAAHQSRTGPYQPALVRP